MTTVQRPIEEETKEPEPSQTVQPTVGAATSAPSVDALPRVNQQHVETVQLSADVNQATLLAFQSILAQQLDEKLREQREHQELLQEKAQVKAQEQLEEKLRVQRE